MQIKFNKTLNQITVLLQTLSRSHSHESVPCTVDQFFSVSWCTLVVFLPPVAAIASSSGPTCLGTFWKKFSILQNLKTASIQFSSKAIHELNQLKHNLFFLLLLVFFRMLSPSFYTLSWVQSSWLMYNRYCRFLI